MVSCLEIIIRSLQSLLKQKQNRTNKLTYFQHALHHSLRPVSGDGHHSADHPGRAASCSGAVHALPTGHGDGVSKGHGGLSGLWHETWWFRSFLWVTSLRRTFTGYLHYCRYRPHLTMQAYFQELYILYSVEALAINKVVYD